MKTHWWTVALLGGLVGVAGCGGEEGGADGSVPGEDAQVSLMDGGPGVDSGSTGVDAGVPPGGDSGRPPGEDGGPPPWDSGPPEDCETPGAIESVRCGSCGTVERFCTAGRVWAYGTCEGQGGCMPGTSDSVACGNCGTRAAICNESCEWEATGDCTGEGVCAPGTRSRSSMGCAAGETREVLCNDACAQTAVGSCEADGCTTPGALETTPCGNCGTQERFCSSSGVWEYGVCSGEGVCSPGTTEPTACGMCGTRTRRCLASCAWDTGGTCTGEGSCAPGATMRTGAGCPAGQTKELTCNDSCTYVESSACMMATSLDVTVLLDMTGSHGARIGDNLTTLRTRLVTPLLGLGDVAVGVSYYAEFPGSGGGGFPFFDAGPSSGGPGDSTDRPFHGGIEPVRMMSAIDSELASRPSYGGGDLAESGVEALFILTGGAPVPDALPLTCSAGRRAGGCWRSGARRVIIVYTDAPNHNGPDPASSGVYQPYAASLGAASWSNTRSRLLSDGTHVLFLIHGGASGSADANAQASEMLTDLSQPATNRIDATTLSTACDAAVARVRAIGGF